ncbi:MAG: ribonuclease III [Lachnospiraceae bacterium]|nr:ribonuclease III [Lachnospiraceae bacterium]
MRDIREYSPLVCAFVGDAVFDLVIRTAVTLGENRPVRKLHREKAAVVNAHAQAMLAERVAPILTKEEAEILRRGRNAHSQTTPKNQSIADYHMATGLEALVGYLYLTGRTGRLLEILHAGLETGGEADG